MTESTNDTYLLPEEILEDLAASQAAPTIEEKRRALRHVDERVVTQQGWHYYRTQWGYENGPMSHYGPYDERQPVSEYGHGLRVNDRIAKEFRTEFKAIQQGD